MKLMIHNSSAELEQIIYFTETPPESPDSILLLSPVNSPVFFHSLPELKNDSVVRQRSGCSNTPNVFDITGESWLVIGGNQDDEFILHSTQFTSIDGQRGVDTLRLHQDIKSNDFVVDLTKKSQINNVENIYGSPEQPVVIIPDCSTKVVASMGGSTSKSDLVTVPALPCPQRDLKIIVIGNTRVEIASEVGPVESNNIIVVIQPSKIPTQFEMEMQNSMKKDGLILAVQVAHLDWKAVLDWKPKEGTLLVQLKNITSSNEMIALSFLNSSGNINELELPYIEISKLDMDEPSGRLWINQNTLNPQVIFELQNESSSQAKRTASGFVGISNVFRFTSGSWTVKGGDEDDIFVILPSAQLEKQYVDGGNGGNNLLILESDSSKKEIGDTFGVNLDKGALGFLKSSEKDSIKNIQHVMGRSSLPDIIHSTCDTKLINGRGGAGTGLEDMIFISGNGCDGKAKMEAEIHVEKFTKVTNTAANGLFKYHVPSLANIKLRLNASGTNEHLINFGFHPREQLHQISFDEPHQKLGFLGRGKAVTFSMSRSDSLTDYTNPIFQFHKPGTNVTADVQVTKEGIVAITFVLHEAGIGKEEWVLGLKADVNIYLLNITEARGADDAGIVIGSQHTNLNQFWIFNLENQLRTLNGGDCTNCVNSLQLVKSFQRESDAEIHLNRSSGSIKAGPRELISHLINIHELSGRENSRESGVRDKAVLSTCDLYKISKVDEIVIFNDKKNDCAFNLTMEVGESTIVWFEDPGPKTSSMKWVNSTFNYHFTSPRSFDLNGSSSLAWLGPIHNYFLHFTVDDLQWIKFDLEQQRLNYSIAGKMYGHNMIFGASFPDPWYTQPSMITKENFKLQIGRDGSIFFTLGTGSRFPNEEIDSNIMPTFQDAATRLGVTFIIQTDNQFLYIGHENVEGSRNVLQNVNYSVSYLGGGGADDTIYDITSLGKDVFIYPGFDANQTERLSNSKQTIDLTDIVIPIRMATHQKYLPTVKVHHEKDLVITMEGYNQFFPGNIYIIGGAQGLVAYKL